MAELLGAVFFGWLWVNVARLLLLPFSRSTRRTLLIPATLFLVLALFTFAAAHDALNNVSEITLTINAASLSFFLWRAHAGDKREEAAEAKAKVEAQDHEEDEAPPKPARVARAVSARTKEASKPKGDEPKLQAAPAKAKLDAPAPVAAGPGAFEGETDDGEAWRVDLDAMTLDLRGQAYRLRRTTDGAWQARERGGEWLPLDDLDGHLATVTDTRWRRYVKA